MTSSSSMKAMIWILPWHFAQVREAASIDLLDQSGPILSDCRFGAVFEQMLALSNYFDRVILIMVQD